MVNAPGAREQMMVRCFIGVVTAALALIASILGLNTAGFRPDATTAPVILAAAASDVAIDRDAAAKRLGEMLRFRTVSVQAGQAQDLTPFTAQRAWIEARYPALHQAASKEVVSGESLLYTWMGSEPKSPPILLLAHLDVVPVEAWALKVWQAEPFGGEVKDGYVWGRGAIDNKGSVVAILEAANALAASGFKPKRTIHIAFGHDEEVSGLQGAVQIAALLKARGVKAWFALDEGQAIIAKNPLTGKSTALIGVSEKGYATMRLTAIAQAGHSSVPPPVTAVTLLSEALPRINRLPVKMSLAGGPGEDMVRALGDQLPLTTRIAAANEWLFAPLIRQQLGSNPTAAAMMRTTIAATMLEGSPKENIIPGRASALINFRLHPRDKAADILAMAKAAVADLSVKAAPGGVDRTVTVEWNSPPNEASPVSSTQSDSYALIAAVARAAAPDAPVTPSLVLAATDSRHYVNVAENVYRFSPIVLDTPDIECIHGQNERLSIENLERMIRGYVQLITTGAG